MASKATGNGPEFEDGDRTGALEATASREFVCPDCSRRCTRGTEGTEYGHARSMSTDDGRGPCPRRPSSVDPYSRQGAGRDAPGSPGPEDQS